MGASASHPSEDGIHPPVRALHVLRVTPGSPASMTDIEPFFDFVVSVDQGLLGDSAKGIDVNYLERIVESHEGQQLSLVVWSSKSETYRQVTITPSRVWSIPAGSASPYTAHSRLPSTSHSAHSRGGSLDSNGGSRKPSLLGLSMRVCEPATSLDNVWHILEVLEGSPAESAGLVPYGDWIIGWSGGVLKGENDFLDVVEAHVEKPLRVYVYSYDFDTLREVVLVPNRMWGGEGLLGCGVGFGLLHRIPKTRQELFAASEDEYSLSDEPNHLQHNGYHEEGFDDMQEQELFVPADDIIYDDEGDYEHQHDQPSNIHAPEPSPPAARRVHSNPFLPDETPAPPTIQAHPPPPSSDSAESEGSPSPSSTPTPSSPSFHGSELTPEPVQTPIATPTPLNRVASNSNSSRASPLNSFRQPYGASGWVGGAANRFAPTPRIPTPTQRNFNPRHRDMDHGSGSDDDDDDSGSGGPRRSPNGSMTSVDD